MTLTRLESTSKAGWPRLAWLARCVPGEPAVEVLHGAAVEVTDGWLCEAVWDGDYAAAASTRQTSWREVACGCATAR